MAELPPLLVNQTRWSDLLKQLAVLKGLDHVELAATLIGALVLENDRPEHKYLAGEHLAWGQYLHAAVAAVTSYVGLRNPSGSGKILIVEAVNARRNGAGGFFFALARGETATQQNTEQPRDTRIQPSGAFGTFAPNIVGQVVSARSDTITVTPFVVAEYGSPGESSRPIWEQPFVLAPGDTFYVFDSDGSGAAVVNEKCQASFVWRERTLEPTET